VTVSPVPPVFATVLRVALALPLAVYASVGTFARYTADDYCWAGVLRTEGFFSAQAQWYTLYSPRYAFTFIVNVVELAGPAIVPALPIAAILVWLATLTWTFLQFGFRSMRALLLAELAALATLQTAPDLPQSLYWQTGMLTYLLPLILATFLLGWIRRASMGPRLSYAQLVPCTLVTFIAGGLSETYLIPQNVALTLALVACVALVYRGEARPLVLAYLAAALAGGVLALVVILVAPATALRVGGTPADLWLASSAAIATAAYQVARLLRFFLPTVLLCLVVPALLGTPAPPISRRTLVLVTVGVAITLPFCYFPSFYAQNGNPPARSLIVPGAILIGYLVFSGYALSAFALRLRPPVPIVAAAMVALVPIGIAAVSLPELTIAAQHAALWDAEDQQIRAARDAGQADVSVPPLPAYLGENFVTGDRDDWFNRCVARYYGVRSIATTS
jgi:hypothetical protein